MEGFTCPVCGGVLCWDSDEDAEDAGCEVKGILSIFHCAVCEAMVDILFPAKEEDKNDDKRNGGYAMKGYIVTTEAGEIFRMRANDITDLPVEINGSEVIAIMRNKEEE